MSLLSHFRTHDKKKSLTDEIFESICDLLNTKKTFGSHQKDLGIDSYVYLGSNREITKQITEDIKECIQKFERRVTVVEVVSVPSKNRFLLSFTIKCKIGSDNHLFHLSFHHQKNLFNMESAV